MLISSAEPEGFQKMMTEMKNMGDFLESFIIIETVHD